MIMFCMLRISCHGKRWTTMIIDPSSSLHYTDVMNYTKRIQYLEDKEYEIMYVPF